MALRRILAALVLGAVAQTAGAASAQPVPAGVAESIKLCSRTAVCSFVVGYPAERLMFVDPGAAAKPPLRSGIICNDGWLDRSHAGPTSKAEMLTQGADGAWAAHWTAIGPTRCHKFHEVVNIRLRAANPQSAWRAIFQRTDN